MQHQSISTSRGRNVGAMTAHMRALGTGPRCLRVALVIDGRIAEERRVRAGSSLSIGSSERADLVVPGPHIPARFILFEAVGERHRLRPLPGTRGRIANSDGVGTLGKDAVELDATARGKLELGLATLLFQVVPEPPRFAKPQLPRAVINAPLRVDWTTSVIAAFSFLLHFLLAGALYSEWLDPVLDQGLTVSGLVDSGLVLPTAPEVETSRTEPSTIGTAPAPPSVKAPKPGEPRGGKQNGTTAGPGGNPSAASLGRELDALEVATLGALGSGRPATADVLKGSEVPTGSLDAAAASAQGVSGPGQLSLVRGGPIRQGTSDLSALGNIKIIDVHDPGNVKPTEGPRGAVQSSNPIVHGSVGNASRVVEIGRAHV